jgi:hypothetical protein
MIFCYGTKIIRKRRDTGYLLNAEPSNMVKVYSPDLLAHLQVKQCQRNTKNKPNYICP